MRTLALEPLQACPKPPKRVYDVLRGHRPPLRVLRILFCSSRQLRDAAGENIGEDEVGLSQRLRESMGVEGSDSCRLQDPLCAQFHGLRVRMRVEVAGRERDAGVGVEQRARKRMATGSRGQGERERERHQELPGDAWWRRMWQALPEVAACHVSFESHFGGTC